MFIHPVLNRDSRNRWYYHDFIIGLYSRSYGIEIVKRKQTLKKSNKFTYEDAIFFLDDIKNKLGSGIHDENLQSTIEIESKETLSHLFKETPSCGSVDMLQITAFWNVAKFLIDRDCTEFLKNENFKYKLRFALEEASQKSRDINCPISDDYKNLLKNYSRYGDYVGYVPKQYSKQLKHKKSKLHLEFFNINSNKKKLRELCKIM